MLDKHVLMEYLNFDLHRVQVLIEDNLTFSILTMLHNHLEMLLSIFDIQLTYPNHLMNKKLHLELNNHLGHQLPIDSMKP